MWFPRLASERVLRQHPVEGPFALVGRSGQADHLYCLNAAAEASGLYRGMALAGARAVCPGLHTRDADPVRDRHFLQALCRWAGRYSPWVGYDGADGLILDVTGVAHLFGGEAMLLADMAGRLERGGLTVATGLACTRGAAHALARGGGGIAQPGRCLDAIGSLAPTALRLDAQTGAALGRLGIRSIRDLVRFPRATLARRFGPSLLQRLDQALGDQPEPVSPAAAPPHFAVRMTLPEPIGLSADVMAGLRRLLDRLCERLAEAGHGARQLRLELRRVDGGVVQTRIDLARPMRVPGDMAALFERAVDSIDAGFGIDALRLSAPSTESLPARQVTTARETGADRQADLVTRLGNRVGFENILRFHPAESHIPERSFLAHHAAWSEPAGDWPAGPERPLVIFAPEPIAIRGRTPPRRFRWRRMDFTTLRATGPERIAPEWWFDDPAWRSGLRDYWKIETHQGRRLWLFHTPQAPGWCVQGEFA